MRSICFFLLLLFLQSSSIIYAQSIALQLSGNKTSGYYVSIVYDNKVIADNTATGEFNLVVENSDRSICDTLQAWKATNATQSEEGIKLSGRYYQKDLMTYITI